MEAINSRIDEMIVGEKDHAHVRKLAVQERSVGERGGVAMKKGGGPDQLSHIDWGFNQG